MALTKVYREIEVYNLSSIAHSFYWKMNTFYCTRTLDDRINQIMFFLCLSPLYSIETRKLSLETAHNML